MFLLIDVIVWDIKIKLQAQILKLYVLQKTEWTTFLRDIWIKNPNEISVAVCPGDASCSKLRLVQKFECRVWKLKKQIQFNFFVYNWLLYAPKIKRENYPRKYFWLAGNKFNPRKAIIGLQTTGPRKVSGALSEKWLYMWALQQHVLCFRYKPNDTTRALLRGPFPGQKHKSMSSKERIRITTQENSKQAHVSSRI